MATITIRKLDEQIKAKLRVRAARRGHSMEEEAREILKLALAADNTSSESLADAIRRHVKPLGGVELQLPRRQSLRKPPALR